MTPKVLFVKVESCYCFYWEGIEPSKAGPQTSTTHAGIPDKGLWNSSPFLFPLSLLASEGQPQSLKQQPDHRMQPPKVQSKINLILDICHSKMKLMHERNSGQMREGRGRCLLKWKEMFVTASYEHWRATVERTSDGKIALALCVYLCIFMGVVRYFDTSESC